MGKQVEAFAKLRAEHNMLRASMFQAENEAYKKASVELKASGLTCIQAHKILYPQPIGE